MDSERPGSLIGAAAEDSQPRRILRIALALRGGVSLAVWIGGAMSEIDVLRRVRLEDDGRATLRRPEWTGTRPGQTKRAEIYGDLLRLAGYHQVDVDILAGASAGGLNAVIYGVAQSVGATMDSMEAVWRDAAGIWKMLRPTLPTGRVPSLLSGDLYFYQEIRKELSSLVRRGDPDVAAEEVTIDLSATLLADEGVVERALREGRAQFHFVRRQAPLESGFTDLPGPSDVTDNAGELPPPVQFQLDRLALAGRSTSSFPGAFEPASIHAVAGRSTAYAEGTDATNVPEMSGTFSGTRPAGTPLHGPGARPFHVIDGGVFDNIPIDRALRAINIARSSAPTERRLIYLDPDPPTPVAAHTRGSDYRSALHWLRTITRAIAMKQRSETVDDELGLIREHNDRALAARGRQEALARQLSRTERLTDAQLDDKAYATYRLATDTPRLTLLLTRPAQATIGRTPLAGPYEVLGEPEALTVENMLATAYYDRDVCPRLSCDIHAVNDTATLLIAWIRELEAKQLRSELPEPRDVSRLKRPLYRLLRIAVRIRDLADAEFLRDFRGPTRQRSEPPDLATAVRRSLNYQHALAPLGERLTEALDVNTSVDEIDFYRRLAERYPVRGVVIDSPESTADWRLLNDLWCCLENIRREIQERGAAIADARYRSGVSPAEQKHWDDSLFHVLHHSPLQFVEITKLHTVFAAAGGVPGTTSTIRYHQVTGNQPTPFEALFTKLVRAERETRLLARLHKSPVDPTTPLLSSKSKLAGNTARNFGGFIASRWRTNDWAWGQLDATGGLVDMLLNDANLRNNFEALQQAWNRYVEKLPPELSLSEWQGMLTPVYATVPPRPVKDAPVSRQQLDCLKRGAQAWLQYWLLTDSDTADGVATPTARQRAESFVAGSETVRDLRPAYRFGLASRLTQLLYRAFWPSTWTWYTAMVRVLMLAGRPLWVLLPLAADPLRATATAVLLLLAAAVTGPDADGTSRSGFTPTSVAAVTALAVAAIMCGWQLSAWLAWHRLRHQARQWGEDWAASAERLWRRARLRACIGWAMSVAFAVLGFWLLRAPRSESGARIGPGLASWPETIACSAALIAIAVVVSKWPLSVRGPRRKRVPARMLGWLLVAIGLALTVSPRLRRLCVTAIEDLPILGTDDPAVGLLLLVGALSGLLLLGWSHKWWTLGAVLATAVAVTTVAEVAAHRHPEMPPAQSLGIALLGWVIAMALVTAVLPTRKEMVE
ncbi:patatin-like protein [Micromonospora sp. CPCC 205556]|uniref:patatin-like protein n=1 Tax=Micromonospora sp. CPCC 205556 TaxID=3122398 RepID=UPI002FEEC117